MYNGVTSSNGEAAKTGAPGENTCTQCHTSYAINDPAGSITANVVGATGGQYQAGQTYQVTVNIAKAGASIFGFSGVALDASGANIGTIVAGSDNHTQASSASGTNRTYVLQNMNGGLAADQKTFTFSWTAPATASGNVSFYFTGLAGNNNGGNSGDYVYSTTLTLTPASMGGGGNVVINEVDCDQSGPDTQEFVELYGTPNMSLTGYTIVFFNGANSLAYASFDLDGYTLDANGFFVLGNPLVPNVDLTFDPGASGAMQNGADAVALFLADATTWPVDAPASNVGLVDALVYGTADADAAGLLTALVPGQLQVNETAGNIPECLARIPDGGTPLVVTSYVQQLPTPGASNSTTVIAGCMNSNACNYNSAATIDDNSCLYTGTTCDDGNPNSTGDAIDASCLCTGTITQVNVTFQVDMNTSTVAPTGVFLQGDFQNWQASPDIVMTDANADGVYEVTVVLPANSPFQYKFLNGTGGWEVTPALAACGTPDLVNVDGYNRADTTAISDLILPVVCFGSCNACNVSSTGCMIPNACNYDPTATVNDIASCVFASTWYLDADADGYYASSTSSCTNPGAGYTATQGINGDCNDAVASIHTGATEICGNGIDEDCSGADLSCVVSGCTNNTACNYNASATVDDGSCTFATTWYLDADADGYYVSTTSSCTNPGAGYTATQGINGDCNDAVATIHTGATEICGNGIDEDCSGADLACVVPGCTNSTACNYNALATVDDGSCTFATTWYLDADADGYYVSTTSACTSPGAGYTPTQGQSGDCNDASATVHPNATEFCGNGIDENCDGLDETCTGIPGCTDVAACNYDAAATQNNGSCVYANNWYLDGDADGFYVSSVSSCTNPGAGYTSTQGILGDCNDADATINASAVEICGDNIDQDCSGADLACVVLGCTDATACNFESAATQDDGSCIYSTDWYLDMDVDGYASEILNACFSPGIDYTATVLSVTDCDDTDAAINPGATDVCENGIDEDCSGADASCNVSGCMDATACNYNASATQDDGSCFYSTLWYLDADADGYYLITVQSCISPGANFNNIGGIQGDCDDANAAVNAAANEVCGNTIDENCDGVLEDCQPGCPNPVIITLDSLVNLECFGIPTGYIGVSVTGGSGLYYALWNTNPIQTTSYAHNLPAGTYSIYVHDTQGCGDTLTVEVTQPAGSFPVVSGNNDTAPAENAQYTVNTFPGSTYTWTVTGGVIVSGQGTDTINVIWNDVQFGNVTVTQLSDSCELSDGITIFVNGVGIDEMETGISIYPNPALNEVNIQSNAAIGNWEIVDMSGRRISMGLENGNIVHLEVTDWSPGLYLVKTNEGIFKLMVQ
jgi:hypothetical protein